jgi:hypothetical protein
MKVVVIGDIHGNLDLTPRMRTGISSADLIFLNGDLTNFGTPQHLHKLLENLREHASAPIKAVPGNCDTPEVFLEIERVGINLHRSGEVIADGLGIMAVGGSNISPFKMPIEFTDDDISKFLADGFDKIKDCESVILISHFPPKDTNADKISSGPHVGSPALREFILQHPSIKLVICGHIHEAMGTDELGGIPVVNHGMASQGHFVVIEAAPGMEGRWGITFKAY